MEQNQIKLEMWQFLVILLGIGLISGIVFGTAIFLLGKRKNNRKLGNTGALVCFLTGFILGPLPGLIAAVIFAILIFRRKPENAFGNNAAAEQEII